MWRAMLRRVLAGRPRARLRRRVCSLWKRSRRLAMPEWRMPGRRRLRVLQSLLRSELRLQRWVWQWRLLCEWMWLLEVQGLLLRRRLSGRAVRLFSLRFTILGLRGASPSKRLRDRSRMPLRYGKPSAWTASPRRVLRPRLLLRSLLRSARARLLQLGRSALQLHAGPAGRPDGLPVLHAPRPARFPARQPAIDWAVLKREWRVTSGEKEKPSDVWPKADG